MIVRSALGYVSLILVGVCVLAGCRQKPENDLTSRVDEIFAEWDRSDSPGCALAVIRDGQIVYQRGYGMADLEHDVPIEPDSVFYIGSVSKQFVAMTLLLLEEQERLSLDDDIRKYLPDFPDYGTTITIRHLIHHTSGIRDYLELWVLSGRDYLDRVPAQAAYDLICRQEKLNFQPGDRHLYSNSCYFLMPLIVERITGQSFKDFAREQILEPLGMDDTHFHSETKHVIQNRAVGYEQQEKAVSAAWPCALPWLVRVASIRPCVIWRNGMRTSTRTDWAEEAPNSLRRCTPMAA